MSSYPQPTEITPIFVPQYWIPSEETGSGISQSEADARYLLIAGNQTVLGEETFQNGIKTDDIAPNTGSDVDIDGNVNLSSGNTYQINGVDLIASQTGQSGKYLTTDGTSTSWDTVGGLPSQTGQSGKYLTTNGTSASWATVPDEIPSQTGEAGKFLTTDGTSVGWADVPDEIPSQTGQNGKYLTTDGTTASWDVLPSDLPSQTGNAGLYLTTDGSNPSWSTVTSVGTLSSLDVNGTSTFIGSLTQSGATCNLQETIINRVAPTNGNIIDLQQGSVSKFRVDNFGKIFGDELEISAQTTLDSVSCTDLTVTSSMDIQGNAVIDTDLFYADVVLRRIGFFTDSPLHPLDINNDCNVRTGFEYKINGSSVLNSTTLGTGVVSSSLTSVGTLSTLNISGDLTVDTSSLKVDSTNNRVGIGVTNPAYKLEVDGGLNLLTGHDYRINGSSVLNSTTLGTGVVSSSLTSVGTLSSLTVSGDVNIDSNTLTVDATNNRVGINTVTPSYSCDVTGNINISTGSNYLINGVRTNLRQNLRSGGNGNATYTPAVNGGFTAITWISTNGYFGSLGNYNEFSLSVPLSSFNVPSSGAYHIFVSCVANPTSAQNLCFAFRIAGSTIIRNTATNILQSNFNGEPLTASAVLFLNSANTFEVAILNAGSTSVDLRTNADNNLIQLSMTRIN